MKEPVRTISEIRAESKERTYRVAVKILDGMTLSDVAKSIGVSPTRARQIFAKALRGCLSPEFDTYNDKGASGLSTPSPKDAIKNKEYWKDRLYRWYKS